MYVTASFGEKEGLPTGTLTLTWTDDGDVTPLRVLTPEAEEVEEMTTARLLLSIKERAILMKETPTLEKWSNTGKC